MYKQIVEIENETVQLTWDDSNYRNFAVLQNGAQVATIADKAYLKAGQRIKLPNGKDITIILSKSHGLELWYNGKECISNAASGDIDYYRRAGNGLIIIGALQAFSSLAILMGVTDNTVGMLIGFVLLGMALTFIGAGIWGKKTYDKRAFWVGFGLCVINFPPVLLVFSIIGAVMIGFLAYHCIKATQSTPPRHLVMRVDDGEVPFDQI